LVSAGLDSVTVSLDALDPEKFAALTGNGHRVATVLEAIEAAHIAFGKVKLNTVLLRGENEDQIEPLARYFQRPGFTLRFIEFMDVGTLNRWSRDRVVSGDEVLGRLKPLGVLVPRPKVHPGETSETWAWEDGNGAVGFINSITRPFCGDCSRARLGADGKLYTCLFSAAGHDLRTPLRAGVTVNDLARRLTKIWLGRSDRYSELRTDGSGQRVEMFAVGG
jgi:cyclic pyranopterin phosphate synthase